MIKIVEKEFVAGKDLVLFKLENSDSVVMTIPEYNRLPEHGDELGIIHNGLVHQYTVVLSEKEYTDDDYELLGFEKLV